MNQIRVLCTSVGNDGFPSVADALRADKRIFIVGCDTDEKAPGLTLSDEGFIVPFRKNELVLIDCIKGIIEDKRIDVLLPLSTEDQFFYAKNRSEFEKTGVKVAVSSFESVSLANNKHLLYAFCKKEGFAVPTFKVHDDSNDILTVLNRYRVKNENCVIKKALGTGAQGVKIVDAKISSTSRFWSRDNIRISFDEAISFFEGNKPDYSVMICDYLPGLHVSVDAFRAADGKFIASARTEENHLYGTGRTGKIIDAPELILKSEQLAEKIGLTECFNIEYKTDAEGQHKILEINPRFPASIAHTVMAGLNLPLLVIYQQIGITTPELFKIRLLDLSVGKVLKTIRVS